MSGMTVYVFRATLEAAFIVYRDIAVRPNQSLGTLLKSILESFDFDERFDAEIHKCDGAGKLVSSLNLKSPPMLNECVDSPHQEFKLIYNGSKTFHFNINLLKIDALTPDYYPICINKKGLSPAQYDSEKVEDLTHLTHKQLLEIKASFR